MFRDIFVEIRIALDHLIAQGFPVSFDPVGIHEGFHACLCGRHRSDLDTTLALVELIPSRDDAVVFRKSI